MEYFPILESRKKMTITVDIEAENAVLSALNLKNYLNL